MTKSSKRLSAFLLVWGLKLAATQASSSTSLSRQSVLFDFGWKHRTGLTDWAAPDDLPPTQTDPGWHPPEAQPDYDDEDWLDVQLPHDGLIVNPPSQKACPDGCSGRSYIPRHALWYRKTFQLPPQWISTPSIVSLEFEGSFRNTTVFLNGQRVLNHVCGYTPFSVPISNLTLSQQSIAVFVDPDNGDNGSPSSGSGWWYEGGGLYRHVRLLRTPLVHVAPHGLFVKSHVLPTQTTTTLIKYRAAMLELEATIHKNGEHSEDRAICYHFDITPPQEGAAKISTPVKEVPWKDTDVECIVKEHIALDSTRLWTSRQPYLYQVDVVLSECATKHTNRAVIKDDDELDRVSVQHGIRKIHFDANYGFFLNDAHFKIRGFCDHDTFAVVGMALPDRINLFRAQASRSVGGNGRRTSHNPPDPTLLDIYDRLGMVVMDENRLFGNTTAYVNNMAHLVQRDRNHPSVVIWSFCNEVFCEGDNEQGGPAFQAITEKYDGTRPTLANMFSFNDLLSNTVDVQGLSHESREQLDKCHATMPEKPIFLSECCSCNSMRDEDEGIETMHDNPHKAVEQKSFNARCLDKLVNASDGVLYSAGTMIWTLFDYYGEPPSPGMHVSSTYGQYDLCGFPKSAAFWFRTQWLLGVPDGRVDKPFPTNGAQEVHLVESWESPDSWKYTRGNKTRTIHAYSNAPITELFVNGKSQGLLPITPMILGDGGSYAEWKSVSWEPGTLEVTALDKDSFQVAKASVKTNGKATAVVLSLDCPSEITGTGSALFLDGHDVALVRASIVDSQGHVVHQATNNITFTVVSGPGVIQGCANGDPKSYQPHVSNYQTAYHGLVRAVVRVTSIAGLSTEEKTLLQHVDGPIRLSGREVTAGPSLTDTDDIIIEASSPGLGTSMQLRIPTSTDASTSSVLAVAAMGAGKPVDFFKGIPGTVTAEFVASER